MAIEQIAFHLNRRDEVPNQELAARLEKLRDTAGIREIAGGLRDPVEAVRSDCIKVLFEIGYINQALVAEYVDEFLDLLSNRRNRLVWGGANALSTV